ncbi:MAG: 2,3,4,5-tetrahydropyridine-2,6-carboxylate N-succinyltransferase [Flammeovirgaceae bacterium]|jgi:2,3,4,5-tetrahydropyridine-2-carboxylate N-succinyltransferase|nr:2,3,4,5-tetrahydropyridine-2,6-carboxylate N-succinyltransferase [Flammeovirgaceae bacterium]|tara:strand:- start:491 stop:1417 length:927 start_codon:yes stop_codon:yes gene_type:complete
MNKFPLIASGVASTSLNGEILAIRYTKIVCKSENADEYKSLESEKQIPSIIKDRERFIFHKLNQDTAIKNVKDAYLKLHLLSLKLVKPNTINLEGIFNALPNVVWTSQGPVHPDDLEEIRKDNDSLYVRSIDKFPCLTDYVIPEGIRIADASRVRLGAYLSEGTTVMHEGFVNFNAGTLGPAMIEGRISAGVVIGANSDLGGGCSTMGTLSGGNDVKISVGEDCLLGANSGLGIPLGDRCIVEAGLYLTAGSKVEVLDKNNELVKTVKASELSSKDDQLFIRNSLTGAIQCKPNRKKVSLNDQLHTND